MTKDDYRALCEAADRGDLEAADILRAEAYADPDDVARAIRLWRDACDRCSGGES